MLGKEEGKFSFHLSAALPVSVFMYPTTLPLPPTPYQNCLEVYIHKERKGTYSLYQKVWRVTTVASTKNRQKPQERLKDKGFPLQKKILKSYKKFRLAWQISLHRHWLQPPKSTDRKKRAMDGGEKWGKGKARRRYWDFSFLGEKGWLQTFCDASVGCP